MLKAKAHSQLLCQSPWRTFFDSFSFPAAISNARHCFTYVNPAFERFYGVKLEDVIGVSPWILMPKNHGLRTVKLLRKALANKNGVWSGEFTNVNAAGKSVQIHLVVAGLRGHPEGAPVGYLSIVAPEKEGDQLLPELARHMGENWLQHAAACMGSTPIEHDGRGERQEEILRLTRMGYSTKEVATFMGIATSTVANVKWKLNRRGQARRKR
jgi:PAS domain S-box-containing protein